MCYLLYFKDSLEYFTHYRTPLFYSRGDSGHIQNHLFEVSVWQTNSKKSTTSTYQNPGDKGWYLLHMCVIISSNSVSLLRT